MTDRAEPFQDDAWYAWEEEGSEQSWLLAYVDVLCVILAMVLVLLVSQMQPEAAPEGATVSEAPPQTIEPLPVMADPEAFTLPGFEPLSAALPPPPESGALRPVAAIWALEPGTEPLPEIPARATLDEPVEEDGVEIVHDSEGMTLQIAEVVLFDSSKARLKDSAGPVLERAVMLLNAFGEVDVAVQGHTDDRPVQGGQYQSNWELASARANAVAAFLLASGFPPERLRLESYADTRPIADNTTDEGRSRNRRVELRVEMTPLASAPAGDAYRSDS